MKTSKAKLLSAAFIAAALLATVAIARTVHTHTATAGALPAHTSAMGTARNETMASPPHGILACGMANNSNCEKLGQMLPM
jgi:hypothetical protein